MSLRFVKMFPFQKRRTDSGAGAADLGFSLHSDFLIKKYENQLSAILLRDFAIPGTVVKKIGTDVTIQTTTTLAVSAGQKVIKVVDGAGFHKLNGTIRIGTDPKEYEILAVAADEITLTTPLEVGQAAGVTVIGSMRNMVYAARVVEEARIGESLIKVSTLQNLEVGMNVYLGLNSTPYEVQGFGQDNGQDYILITPELKTTATVDRLVYSYDVAKTLRYVHEDVSFGSTTVTIRNGGFLVGDRIKFGSDPQVYDITAVTKREDVDSNITDYIYTLAQPLKRSYKGAVGPLLVKRFYLYTLQGALVHSSALKYSLKADIVSVCYDASSKLQYFLMAHVSEETGNYKYFLIRGDLSTQVFHYETRSLDLEGMPEGSYPIDFSVYQNGVFVLTNVGTVHLYSLRGTHRQKLEFKNFDATLRSIDYFADFVSTYNNVGSVYDGADRVFTGTSAPLYFQVGSYVYSPGPNGATETYTGPLNLRSSTKGMDAEFQVGPLSSKKLSELSLRDLFVADGLLEPISNFVDADGKPLNNYHLRNRLLSSVEPANYLDRTVLGASYYEKWVKDYETIETNYKNAKFTALPEAVVNPSNSPLQRRFNRWLCLYDDAGYIYVWDLILNKIVLVTRTGMHYGSARLSVGLGLEKYMKTPAEITQQLKPYFQDAVLSGSNSIVNKLINNGVAELDITSSLEVTYKDLNDYLDAILDSKLFVEYRESQSIYGTSKNMVVYAGPGNTFTWKRRLTVEGVKTEGIDFEKSPVLSLHDYVSAEETVEGVEYSHKYVLEHDVFTPALSTRPNGIALVSHEMRNENPQFTFTVKLWGDVGEPIVRQRVYVEMFVYNDATGTAGVPNSSVQTNNNLDIPVWQPDPIYVFTDDRGLATGTFKMPEQPIEGHIVLKMSTQAILQPDKEDLYVFEVSPSVAKSGETIELGIWGISNATGSEVALMLDTNTIIKPVLVDATSMKYKVTLPSLVDRKTLRMTVVEVATADQSVLREGNTVLLLVK